MRTLNTFDVRFVITDLFYNVFKKTLHFKASKKLSLQHAAFQRYLPTLVTTYFNVVHKNRNACDRYTHVSKGTAWIKCSGS